MQTLRKYRRVFKLGDPQTLGTKEELLPAVLRHWQQQARPSLTRCAAPRVSSLTRCAPARVACQVMEEDETVLAFAFSLRKQATGGASPMGVGAGKAKPKPGFGAGVGGKGKYK